MNNNFKNLKKIGVIGGTFDPIHNGHLHICQMVKEKLNLDGIVFMPTGTTPHKDNFLISQREHRYNMVQLAINSNPSFFISDIEIKNDQTSYTVETLKILKNEIRPDAQIFFITGFDTAEQILLWREPEKLKDYCTIVSVARPGYNKTILKKIEKKLNVKMEIIEGNTLDISSTQIRAAINNNESLMYVLPENVLTYIQKNKLYIDQIISQNIIDNIIKDIKLEISKERFIHVMGVAETAKKLAGIFGENEKLAYVSGLLHDYAKEFSKKEKKEFCKKHNIFLDDFTKENIDIAHGVISGTIGFEKYGLKNLDLFNAIKFHTIGRDNMSLLEKILFVADTIEPSRGSYVDYIRDIAFSNLDIATLKSFELKIQYTKKKKMEVHPLSLVGLNFLKGENNNE